MNRYTVAALLDTILEELCLPDICTTEQGGLIETAFVIVYFVVPPCFGYVGDRYSR